MKKNKNRILFYLSYAVLVTALVSTATLSRYLSNSTGSGDVEVAAIFIDGSYSESFVIGLENISANQATQLQFDIVNYDDIRQSEVAQSYSISIKSTNNLPLKFSLLNNGQSGQIESAEFIYDATSDSYKLTGGSMPVSTTKHSYTLVVQFESKDVKYNKEIDAIEIYIEAVQIGS